MTFYKFSRVLTVVAVVCLCLVSVETAVPSGVDQDKLSRSMALGGSIPLTAFGTAYTQNFNTLGSASGADYTVATGPAGWDFIEGGASANAIYGAAHGSSAAGNTYSFGVDTVSERAFGGLRSGNVVPTVGAQFTNNTGAAIGALIIAYTGEQWRLGLAGRVDRLDLQYSTNATSLDTGTWIDVDSLDFIAPVTTGAVGLRDGNTAPNRTAISGAVTGLAIPNGMSFWLRWSDLDATGADDGLGVDDFSLTPTPIVSAANVSLSGRVTTADDRGITNARVTLTGNDGQPRFAVTGPFGYFTFGDLHAGETYVVSVSSKRFTFPTPSRVVSVNDDLADVDFVADPLE